MEEIASVIREYIAQNILFSSNGYPYPDEASLLEEGVVDSMNVLELVTFVEGEFDLKVPQEDVVPDNFDSVRSLATYIGRKREELP